MQRQILCLIILACASFILVNEVVGDAVENGGSGRKLLQEKTKTKAPKYDKPKVRNADAASKAKVSEGAKLKEKSRDLDVIEVASKNPDGSKAGTDDVKKPASGGKKGKRVLDEEEDEDIKFMEEEKMEGEEQTTSSKQAQTQEGKSASSKNKGSAKKKNVNAGKTKDATETEDLADEKKEADKKVSVDANKEEEMDSQEVEIIPDDEAEDQKVDFSEEKQTHEVPEQKDDEQKEEEVLVQKDKKSEGKVLDQKEQMKKKKKNVEEQVPDTVSAKENATFKKPSTKNGKRPQDKDLPKGNATKSKTAAKKQKPDSKANAKLTTKANSTKKGIVEHPGEILQKEPKEQMPINFGAGEDVEDLQTDAVLSKTGVDMQGDEEENEDIDFIQEFQNLPNKFHQTAEQVAETLRPGLQKISEKSRTYFSHANEHMTHSFAPIMGEQVAPVVASLISYALLLIPLVVVLYMLERIRATLSLAKVLFFINIYLGAYFITLVLATFALRSEPMAFFFKNSRSSCVFLQLLQALGYLFYLLLYTVVFVKSCSNSGILDRLVSGFQWVIVALFGLHYYVTVFHRAMAMKVPRTTWKVYLVYSAAFAILALFARAKIEPTKKEYYYSPVDDPDEVIPVDKRS